MCFIPAKGLGKYGIPGRRREVKTVPPAHPRIQAHELTTRRKRSSEAASSSSLPPGRLQKKKRVLELGIPQARHAHEHGDGYLIPE
jgi:hypothetical protein